MFPGVNISNDATIHTPFAALEQLGQRYDNVTMVVGGDRSDHFFKCMNLYTQKWGIENFDVVSIGERDSSSKGIPGISGSKTRQFVVNGDYTSFSASLSNRLNDGLKKSIYQALRREMEIEEDADNKNANEYRNMGLRGHFAYSGGAR